MALELKNLLREGNLRCFARELKWAFAGLLEFVGDKEIDTILLTERAGRLLKAPLTSFFASKEVSVSIRSITPDYWTDFSQLDSLERLGNHSRVEQARDLISLKQKSLEDCRIQRGNNILVLDEFSASGGTVVNTKAYLCKNFPEKTFFAGSLQVPPRRTGKALQLDFAHENITHYEYLEFEALALIFHSMDFEPLLFKDGHIRAFKDVEGVNPRSAYKMVVRISYLIRDVINGPVSRSDLRDRVNLILALSKPIDSRIK